MWIFLALLNGAIGGWDVYTYGQSHSLICLGAGMFLFGLSSNCFLRIGSP
jgi:hypothetical protein